MRSFTAQASVLLALLCTGQAISQCTVTIPNNAVVFVDEQTTTISNGAAWVCNGGLFDGAAIYTSLFVESGGALNMSGLNKKAYLKAGAYMSCSGIGDTIWYEAGAIIDCSGDHVDILCDEIIFDYSQAPANGCFPTGLIDGDRQAAIRISVNGSYANITTDRAWSATARIELFDPMGRVLASLVPVGENTTIDLAPYGAGMVLIRVLDDNGLLGVGRLVR